MSSGCLFRTGVQFPPPPPSFFPLMQVLSVHLFSTNKIDKEKEFICVFRNITERKKAEESIIKEKAVTIAQKMFKKVIDPEIISRIIELKKEEFQWIKIWHQCLLRCISTIIIVIRMDNDKDYSIY